MRPINLLPPEQAKAAAARRGAILVFFLALLIIGLVGAFAFLRMQALATAEDEVAAQRQRNAALNTEIAALSDADDARRLYAGRSNQITEALAVDVDWGRLVNDLGRVIPPRTWLDSFSGGAAEPDVADEVPTYGSITTAGTGFDYPDASTWFRTLDSTEWGAVGGAWVANLSLSEVGDFGVVNFNSSASLTEQSLSDRVATRVPVIGE